MSGWVKRQIDERPFFSALLILLLVTVPGFVVVENAITTANKAAESAEKTAEDLKEVVKDQTKENEKLLLETCKTRNNAQANGRARFVAFFDGLEAVLLAFPDQTEEDKQKTSAFVDSLKNTVPLDPSTEDVDCNQDGKLTELDYAT